MAVLATRTGPSTIANMLWSLRCLRRGLGDSPSQTLHRLLQQKSSLSLAQLNQGLFEVVQQSVASAIDHTSLTSVQCLQLVRQVSDGVGDLEAGQLVTFCQWQSLATRHFFGWRELVAVDTDRLRERLEDFTQRRELSTLQLQSLLQSLSELKYPSVKLVSDVIEERLAAPEGSWTTQEMLDLLLRLTHMNRHSRKLMDLTARRLQAMDFRKLDITALAQYYENLCSVELFYHNKRYTQLVDRVARHLLEKAKDAEEAALLNFLETHFRLKFHRVLLGKQLLTVLNTRLDGSPSPKFLFAAIRLLISLQDSDQVLISPDLGRRLFTEAAKLLAGSSTADQELVFSAVQVLLPRLPPALVQAGNRLAAHCPSRLWLVAAVRAFEAAQEDASALLTQLPSLLKEVTTYTAEDRLAVLSAVYSKRGVSPFELLESEVLASFEGILQADQVGALRLMGKVIKHPNYLLREKLDYLRREALKLMTLPWPQELPPHSLLYLGFFLCKGNEDVWVQALQANPGKIQPRDLMMAMDQVEDADDCEASVLLTLESLQSSLSADIVVSSHKLLDKNSDPRLVQRYLQLLNRVDPGQVSKHLLLVSFSGIIRLVLTHSLQAVLSAYLPALQRLRKDLAQTGKDKELSLYIVTLLYSAGLIGCSEVISEVQSTIPLAELRGLLPPLALFIWDQLSPQDKSQVLLPMQHFRHDINISAFKVRVEQFVALPEYVPSETFQEVVAKRLASVPPHLYCKATSVVLDLPSRFLTPAEHFVERVVRQVVNMRQGPEYQLQVRQEVKFLQVLARQHLGADHFEEVLARLPLNSQDLRPRDTVRLLLAVTSFGSTYQDTVTALCYNIVSAPQDFLRYTGSILGALSDGNLQQELWSAKAAEALVHSPRQDFSFSPAEAAKVLMFCVRIGMQDNYLIKRLLELSPPCRVDDFDLKRYLLLLNYRERRSNQFSNAAELQTYKELLDKTAWRYFLRQQAPSKYVQDLFVPLETPWKVPEVALMQGKKARLAGDYSFYVELAGKLGVNLQAA